MRESPAALVLSAARVVTAAGALALAVPRALAVAWTQLGTPFDLTLEAPAVNTILLLQYHVRRDGSPFARSAVLAERGHAGALATAPASVEAAPVRRGVAVGSARLLES